MRICVFGAASPTIDPEYMEKVEALGKEMATRGHSLVFGGGGHGLMGAAAKGVKSGGGYILGVIPEFFGEEDVEIVYPHCDKLIEPETMRQRKQIMEERAEAFIVTPGGIGTYEEFFEIYTLKQLGRHQKPIILYNVPSRTGVDIAPSTYAALADHPMIQAIKEASGNLSKVAETAHLVGDKLDIYSGNDDQIVPVLSLGGKGVISVLSDLMPAATSKMCHDYMDGNTAAATKTQLELLPLIDALFCEVNPIPAKAAMAAMGFCENYLNLPLVPMEEAHRQVLLQCMRDVGLQV
mgnify:CR=1 FL=1